MKLTSSLTPPNDRYILHLWNTQIKNISALPKRISSSSPPASSAHIRAKRKPPPLAWTDSKVATPRSSRRRSYPQVRLDKPNDRVYTLHSRHDERMTAGEVASHSQLASRFIAGPALLVFYQILWRNFLSITFRKSLCWFMFPYPQFHLTLMSIFAILTVAFGGFALSRLPSCSQTLTKNPPFWRFFCF